MSETSPARPPSTDPFAMPLGDAMRTQRAIRRLKPDPVDDALVLELIELAQKAPTGSNAQNWEFVVVKDPRGEGAARARSTAAPGVSTAASGAGMARNDPRMLRILDAVQWQADHFAEIPVVVVACLRGPRVPIPPLAATSYYGSIYPSVQNLLLAARAAGPRRGAHHAAALEHVPRAARARAPVVGHAVCRRPARLAAGALRADDAPARRRGRARRPLRQSAVPGTRVARRAVRPNTFALGAAVIGTAFGLLPFAMVRLNSTLGWPRWESDAARAAGVVVMTVGVAIVLHCSRLFARVGRGTPVPLEPPQRLVVTGAYRWSRNPIYVGDVTVLLGLFLHRGELTLLVYAALFALTAHLVIVWREEPDLRGRFGAEYDAYARRVPRWIGPLRAS